MEGVGPRANREVRPAFTILELLLVIGISAIVLTAVAPAYTYLLVTNQLQEELAALTQTLRTARERSVAQFHASAHGVYFEVNPNGPDRYILYEGSSYAGRDPTLDRVLTVDDALTLTLSEGFSDSDLAFALGTGVPDTVGAVTIAHAVSGTRILTVNRYGIVSEVRETSAVATSAGDATIEQGSPGTNDGSGVTLRVYPRNVGFNRRGILAFDLSGIPPGAQIDRADLALKEVATYGQPRTIAVHRVTRPWAESQVTWNSASAGVPWTAPGGDYVAQATDTEVVAWTGQFKTDVWDVRTDVQAFVDGTANDGWILKDANEDTSEAFWYFSSEEGATSPQLTVEFSF